MAADDALQPQALGAGGHGSDGPALVDDHIVGTGALQAASDDVLHPAQVALPDDVGPAVDSPGLDGVPVLMATDGLAHQAGHSGTLGATQRRGVGQVPGSGLGAAKARGQGFRLVPLMAPQLAALPAATALSTCREPLRHPLGVRPGHAAHVQPRHAGTARHPRPGRTHGGNRRPTPARFARAPGPEPMRRDHPAGAAQVQRWPEKISMPNATNWDVAKMLRPRVRALSGMSRRRRFQRERKSFALIINP